MVSTLRCYQPIWPSYEAPVTLTVRTGLYLYLWGIVKKIFASAGLLFQVEPISGPQWLVSRHAKGGYTNDSSAHQSVAD